MRKADKETDDYTLRSTSGEECTSKKETNRSNWKDKKTWVTKGKGRVFQEAMHG